MKKIIFICSVVLYLLTGCSDWINDVGPKDEVESDAFFKTEDGFKSALIGVYGRMTNDETYGRNLTFGFVEQLVQRYDNYGASLTPTDEERAEIYQYATYTSSKSMVESIWGEMYKTIANINSLLKRIANHGDEVLVTPMYRELIEGEALALRALHYFDLLRLWGPVDCLANGEVEVLPWRDEFTSEKVPLMSAKGVLDKIIADLKNAETLLENDPMSFEQHTSDLFLGERQFRLNKYAVKALLARVYLYAGNKAEALKYAKEVIENSELNLVSDNQLDISMNGETLFCLDMHNMKERLKNYWKNTVNMDEELWISTNNIEAVFESNTIGLNDIRYKNGYGFIHGRGRYMARKYLGEDLLYGNRVPMIRLGEIYLICAEAESLDNSVYYINKLRNTRGISRDNNVIAGTLTEQARTDILNKEYQKDFFAEGQWFYFLKRHDIKTFYRFPESEKEMSYYVLPLPDDEKEFGQV